MFKSKVPDKLSQYILIKWDGKRGGKVIAEKGEIIFDTPIEFGGEGRHLCPGEIFLSSIGACLLNTFLFLLDKDIIYLKDLRQEISGTITLGREGYEFSRINIKIFMETELNQEKIISTLEKASRYCYITKAIRRDIQLEIYLFINDSEAIRLR
jgi:uncharacterized OsmC-like protein